MSNQVPVIDIADLESAATRGAIHRACREWGFFQIVRHGIDPALLARVFAVSREFFAQPRAAKQAIARDADNPWGYFDRELTKNRQDWKEIYDYGPADGARLQPRWPAGELRQRFEPTLLAYYAQCKALAMRLLSVLAANLGTMPDQVARSFGDAHTSFLRLNHYPPRPRADGARSDAFGVGEHTDAGALTLLLQDDQPGLEVRRNSRWYPVQPLPGALVVNLGDIAQVWSNDRYTAALHRGITSPTHDRYTVPFFLNPSYETAYEPLSAMVDTIHPALYRRIQWREFRTLRAAGDYADLGEEVQISHYRQPKPPSR